MKLHFTRIAKVLLLGVSDAAFIRLRYAVFKVNLVKPVITSIHQPWCCLGVQTTFHIITKLICASELGARAFLHELFACDLFQPFYFRPTGMLPELLLQIKHYLAQILA